MKRLQIPSAILLTLCLSIPLSYGQDDDRKEDRQALLEKLDVVAEAINNKDISALESVMHENITVVFLNGEVARGIPAVKDYFEKTLGGAEAILKDYSTKAEVSAPARFFGDVVVADGSTEDVYQFTDGLAFTTNSLWSVTLVKTDQDWKVAQLHFSVNIFDNALLNTAKNQLWTFVLTAAVIAVIIGFILGRVSKRG